MGHSTVGFRGMLPILSVGDVRIDLTADLETSLPSFAQVSYYVAAPDRTAVTLPQRRSYFGATYARKK